MMIMLVFVKRFVGRNNVGYFQESDVEQCFPFCDKIKKKRNKKFRDIVIRESVRETLKFILF